MQRHPCNEANLAIAPVASKKPALVLQVVCIGVSYSSFYLQEEVAHPPIASVELPTAAAVDGNAELQATANRAVNGNIGAAQQAEGDDEDDDDAAAVVPSMSVASKQQPGSVIALTERQASLSIQEPGEEAISPLEGLS